MGSVIVHGCMLGVVSVDQKPIKKPWRIASTHRGLLSYLGKNICSGDHDHTPCMGGRVAEMSGYYPVKFARIVLRGLESQELLTVVETGDILTATREENEAYERLPAEEQRRLEQTAKRRHINMGHVRSDELARQMRKRGLNPALRAAFYRVPCSTCLEGQKPEARPVATMHTDNVPWRTTSIDLKEYKPSGMKHKYLVLIDEATRYARTTFFVLFGERFLQCEGSGSGKCTYHYLD